MTHIFTEAELFANFVALAEYVVRVDFSSGPATPTAVDGLQLIVCDTSGGGFTVNLESPTTAPERWRPVVINVGTNAVTIDPGSDTINGQSGTQTINTQYAALDVVHNGTEFYSYIDLTPSLPTVASISSYVLEYDVQAMLDSSAIWLDLARTTLASDGTIVESADASFVIAAAASTPTAIVNSAISGQPVLRDGGGTPPPNGAAYLEMRAVISGRGNLTTNWEDISPLDTLVAGDNNAFSIALVAKLVPAATGTIFSWRGSAVDPGERASFEWGMDATGQLEVLMINDANTESPFVDSGANLASGLYQTYILVFTGTAVQVYEDGVSFISAAFDITGTFLNRATATSGIGIGYTQVAAATSPADMDFLTMAYFDDALTADEVNIITDHYNNLHGI